VIVATVAFGMGIDRSDVRLVVHAGDAEEPRGLPAGDRARRPRRAARRVPAALLGGRRGEVAFADGTQRRRGRRRRRVVAGAAGVAAGDAALRRRRPLPAPAISEYFGQAYDEPNCGACDVCLDELVEIDDGHVLAQKILSAVVRTGQRFGSSHVIDVLRGSRGETVLQRGHDQLPTFGVCKGVPAGLLGNYIDQLIDAGCWCAATASTRRCRSAPRRWPC
jgi:ATP-dependent DNA helicase RecQ